MFEEIDIEKFEKIKRISDECILLKNNIKKLAHNKNKYYIWIIKYDLELLSENNPDWFRYFNVDINKEGDK